MREAIDHALAEVAAERGIRVLHACESGSRAWGFASPDSDYDVRFLYVHDLTWYLRVRRSKDTITRMLPGDLDLVGWELQKALGLFATSNVALFEHLGSDIVYHETDGFAQRLRALVGEFFNPIAAGNHYLSIAQKMRDDHLQGDRVNVKKLFYVLRPLAAFRWIELRDSMPPTRFDAVLAGIDLHAEQLGWIAALRAAKKRANEGDFMALAAPVRAWIDGWLSRCQDVRDVLPSRRGDVALLDEVLRQALQPS